MGMQVNTNLAANNSYRNLTNTQNDLSKSLEKLSSGLRINRASDDAAGLAVSEGLKSQVSGLAVASRNAQDGISVLQTAEGSLNEVTTILQRVRDLAVQAGNDSNNADSRNAITTEVSALTKELTRISGSTNFNGTNLLDGSKSALSFQVGAGANPSSQISVDLSGANVGAIANTLNGLNATGGALTTQADTDVTIDAQTVTGDVVFKQASGKSVTVNFGDASDSRTDADVLATLQEKLGADFNASAGTNGKVTITSADTAATGAVTTTGTGVTTDGTSGTAVPVSALDFSSAAGAAAAIKTLDREITAVTTARASLGADQNRFESVTRNIAVSSENLTAAGSRIRDTDMASEMVNFTRANILSQAGTAMLAQANQSNSGVLKLLS
jgi:flagellin